MPTAPSFATYIRISDEPFDKGGKLYVTVEHPKTHNKRDVRWYSNAEYAKAYGKPADDGIDNLKHVKGFDKGYITVITNDIPEQDEEWMRASVARYIFGIRWYIPSTEDIPPDMPKHFKLIRFSWEEYCGSDERHPKSQDELAAIMRQKIEKGEYVSVNL